MPARDIFHQAVATALIKDEWRITDDPLLLRIGGIDLYVDLGAEKLIAAEKENRQIAVEIKSFRGPSPVSDFHTAIGQFINYRIALTQKQPQRILYLAVPIDTFATFFALPFVQLVIQQNHISILVYDINTEEVIQWID